MSDIWGIGRRISVRLNHLGITTALQLADSNVSMIGKNFDIIVERTMRELNGESCLALEDAPPPKQQIVNSRSFGQRITRLEDMQQAVVLYATRAAEKLREQQSRCRHISVSIAIGRGTIWHVQRAAAACKRRCADVGVGQDKPIRPEQGLVCGTGRAGQ